MIALDLDRTTLAENGTIPERTVRALNKAGEMGVETVIATGRVLDALPKSLSELDHVKYYICSNGASIFEIKGARSKVDLLYEKCLVPEAVEAMVGYVKEKRYMFEAFTAGKAYIGRDYYDLVDKGKLLYRSREYVTTTRNPVEDIFDFTLKHKERIENMNVFFPTQDEKEAFRPLLASIPDSTLTSSIPENYELGGMGVSKGAALEYLMEREGVKADELLAAGDSPNDISMLKLAGISVAVANAEDSVKEVSTYIAQSNEEAGVGQAVEKFVLNQ